MKTLEATMNVPELASSLGISIPSAYKLVKKPGFPFIHIGNRILIPIEAYREWLIREAMKNENEP